MNEWEEGTGTPETICLTLLRDYRELTARELSEHSQLSRPTVDAALRTLERHDLTSSVLKPTGKVGRPGKTYRFEPLDILVGIEIGRHTIRAISSDRAGRIVARYETSRAPQSSRDTFLRDIDVAIASVSENHPIAGIGLAVPGIVKSGDLRISRVLPYLNDWDFTSELSGLHHCPVIIMNDVKAAGLGEARLGHGSTSAVQVTVWLGRRISTAVTLNGHSFEGANGVAGEITAAAETQWTPGSVYGEWQWPNNVSPLENAERAAAGHEEAQESLDTYLASLSFPLARLVAIIDPDLIILAGALSETSAPITSLLGEHIRRRLTIPFLPTIKNSRHGRYAACVGALYSIFRDPQAASLANWTLPPPHSLT